MNTTKQPSLQEIIEYYSFIKQGVWIISDYVFVQLKEESKR